MACARSAMQQKKKTERPQQRTLYCKTSEREPYPPASSTLKETDVTDVQYRQRGDGERQRARRGIGKERGKEKVPQGEVLERGVSSGHVKQ